MRLSNTFILVLILVLCTFSTSFAQEYQTGGTWPVEGPERMSPSPRIELNNPSLSLDESCANYDGLPPIGNQAQQGSCNAWACGYYYLGYLQWQEHGWDMADPDHQMSPAFIYNLLNRGFDGGSSVPEAFKLFKEIGCAPYSDMPYSDSDFTTFPGEQAFRNSHQSRIDEAYTINFTNTQGATDLKNHLLNSNIAVMAINAYPDLQVLSNFDNVYCIDNIDLGEGGGHIVTCIGFDDNFVTRDGVGAWRMVNSWGPNWGDNGFWWMSYEAANHFQIAHPNAFYATDRLDYQPTMITRVEINHTDRHRIKFGVRYWNLGLYEQFFTFNEFMGLPNTEAEFDPNVFTIDITDLVDDVSATEDNYFSISAIDLDAGDGHSGEFVTLSIEDLETGFIATSESMPFDLPDVSNEVLSDIHLYYAAVPPENFDAVIDYSNGEVDMSWSAVTTNDSFLGYDIFKDGEVIGTTTELTFDDNLIEYGSCRYAVKSRWQTTSSAFSNVETVVWVEPIAPSNLHVASVDADGSCRLAWDQTRMVELSYDDGESDDNLMFNDNIDPGAMIAQTFSAPRDGKLNKVGVYIEQVDDIENGLIRLAIFSNSADDNPDSELWVSEQFTPENSADWVWLDLEVNRIWLSDSEKFWVAIIWDELGKTPLGSDTSAPLFSSHKGSLDGTTWFPMGAANPMIRAEYGTDELVNGEEGLQGFNVYKNDHIIDTVESDEHSYVTMMESAGIHTFRIDAIYLQGVVEGEEFEYNWDGNAADVTDSNNLPLTWSVEAPYPNPFNPSTMLTVEMAATAELNVQIFNVLGQRVATLASGKYENGVHRFHFNANGLTSGIYFIRTEVPGKINSIQKVTFMR